MIVQILILVITFVSYVLVRKLKDNGSVNMNTKILKIHGKKKYIKINLQEKIIDLFLPKDGTKRI